MSQGQRQSQVAGASTRGGREAADSTKKLN
jgi:hypothetical protein